MEKTKIKIEATIAADRGKTWEHWTAPEHITNWNFASDDWRCPRATNDLRVGGKYFARMEAKDGSFGFDFEATYDEVAEPSQLAFTMPDGRRAITQFEDLDGKTKVTTVFDAESENPVELQKDGWQAILNNFKKYVEIENSQGFVHETISIRRAFEAPVERVFAAWARPEVRVIWGPPSADEAMEFLENDFRTGGKDVHICGRKGDLRFRVETFYHEIQEPQRLLFTERVSDGDRVLCASLIGVELSTAGTGATDLNLTVQVASLVGQEMVAGNMGGWTAAFRNLDAYLLTQSASSEA